MSNFANENDRHNLQVLNQNNYVNYYFLNKISEYRRIYRVEFSDKVNVDNFSNAKERINKKWKDNNITSVKVEDYFFDLDKNPNSVYIIIEDQK